MRKWKWFLIILLALIACYNIWSLTGRATALSFNNQIIAPAKKEVVSFGIDSGKGNIIGIQPLLNQYQYADTAILTKALDAYFLLAKENKLLQPNTVVVFPEYIGSWLVVANEKKQVFEQKNITDAMVQMVSSNVFTFLYHYFSAPAVKDKIKYAVFGMQAKKMAACYQQVFGSLAKKYKVTIVAGSIVLPDATINKSNAITLNGKNLYNTAAVFEPDGLPANPLIKKIFPVNDEAGFSGCGETTQQPFFNTGAGKMGVLICADSWYPAAYQSFNNQIKFIAVPSLGSTDDIWLAPWNGYNGFKAPADVDTTDYKKISEGDAWKKYSMGPRATKAGILYGMNIFFTGSLWDKKSEGRALILENGQLRELIPALKGRIINLWLR